MYTIYFANSVELYKYTLDSDNLLCINYKKLKYVRS